jgi:hypothetical protein
VAAPLLSVRAAYRRWYAAAGLWAGYFRAVPLVALARGIPIAGGDPLAGAVAGATPEPVAVARELVAAGTAERWLGRPDVLLLLDLPGPTSVAVAAALASHGVRPVLLLFLWPEPEALVPGGPLSAALLAHVPALPRRRRPQAAAQYAFVLGRERAPAATAADQGTHFDNRYDLGAIDLPSPARLRAANVIGVVACRLAAEPPAPDLTDYLGALEADGLPVRRLVLAAE